MRSAMVRSHCESLPHELWQYKNPSRPRGNSWWTNIKKNNRNKYEHIVGGGKCNMLRSMDTLWRITIVNPRGSVYKLCVLVLCTCSVHWLCALALCTGSAYWFCWLALCVGQQSTGNAWRIVTVISLKQTNKFATVPQTRRIFIAVYSLTIWRFDE